MKKVSRNPPKHISPLAHLFSSLIITCSFFSFLALESSGIIQDELNLDFSENANLDYDIVENDPFDENRGLLRS